MIPSRQDRQRSEEREQVQSNMSVPIVQPYDQLSHYKILSKLLGTIVTILVALVGWLGIRLFSQHDEIERRVSRLETRQSVTEIVAKEVDRRLSEMNGKLDQLLERRLNGR